MRYQFLRFPGGKGKAVTFSYDDGVRQDLKFSDVLEKYKIKATFNLNAENLRGSNGLTKDEIQEYILNRGHEIAVHGSYHRAEGTLRPIEGIQDVLNCRLELEERFGLIIRGMAYPDTGIAYFTNGAKYENIKNYLKELDIVYSRTLGGDNNLFNLPQDWHAWMPTAHHNNTNIFDYIEQFLQIDLSKGAIYEAIRQPRLFYLWGHSYEFDSNDNWDHLEAICEKLSGKEDIWYATNMQIYEYVTAYQSLIYSANGTRIYNPTLQTIWLDIDGEHYSVKPGTTIKIK